MPDGYLFDHLAIAVRSWSDGYRCFVSRFGGSWTTGGDAGEFAPGQLSFRLGLRLELLAPGSTRGGFVERFLDGDGPGPHHITLQVPSLTTAIDELEARELHPFGLRVAVPQWQEVFVHPKSAGIGTLLQVVQTDGALHRHVMPSPPGFPTEVPAPSTISWVGLTITDIATATDLFVNVLGGDTALSGPGWTALTWGPGRNLILREGTASPGGPALWATGTAPGVAHVVFGPAAPDWTAFANEQLSPTPVAPDPGTGITVLVLPDPK